MTREEEIKETEALYEKWITEIEAHIERLRLERVFYQTRKGVFNRYVAFTIGLKIRYSERQLRKMISDKDKAISRIP